MSDLRKLDALICQHVYDTDPKYMGDEFRPASDIGDAIGVLEKFCPRDGKNRWELYSQDATGAYYVALFFYDESRPLKRGSGWRCPLPEAICRHVLTVLGVPFEAHVLGVSHE